jgi:hypothetical protein
MYALIFNVWNASVLVIGGIISLWARKKYRETKSRPLLNTLPGVWTSLGLLGTFLAIVLSLSDIQPEPSGIVDNVGRTVEEIQSHGTNSLDIITIINNLVPAFTTSILGLFMALVCTLWAKYEFAQEDKAEDDKLSNVSPEANMREIALNTRQLYQELVEFRKSQEITTREYNEKLNKSICDQNEVLKTFINDFVKRMDDIFKQMRGAIQKQVETFGEEQFTKTSEILASLTDKLSTVSTDIINNQRESVETMMANTNNELDSISISVATALGSLTSEIQASLNSLGSEQSDRLNSIISDYDALASKLSSQNAEFATRMNEQLQLEYEAVQKHNVESLQQMVDLRSAYQEATSDVLTSTLEMNEKATENLRDSMSAFVEDVQSLVSTQCEALGNAITSNVESLNKAYEFIESLIAEIKQNYDQASIAFADAVNVAHRTNEAAEKNIEATSKSLTSVVDTNKNIEKVLNILTNRQENIEQLTKRISSINATIGELQKLESTLNKLTTR